MNFFNSDLRLRIMRRLGFTLIEILVVIAIIMVLAALLFPVFNSAKLEAKHKECQMRLKQLTTALNLYRIDNDGLGYVWASYAGKSYRYPYNMFEPVKSYLTTGDLCWCPEGSKSETTAFEFYHYHTWTEQVPKDQIGRAHV